MRLQRFGSRWIHVLLALAALGAGAGCAMAEMAPAPEAQAPLDGRAGTPESAPPGSAVSSDAPAPTPEEMVPVRHVIYTARLAVVVAAVDPALARAKEAAEKAQGWMQEQQGGRLVLRVPAARFREAMSAIESLGIVAERDIKAEDVTEQFVDLEARLKNARAVAERLRELLAKAKDVKEALEVEQALTRLGEEIERMEGRLRFLKSRVAYSTIVVDFRTKAPVPAAIEPLVRLPYPWLRGLELPALLETAERSRRFE